jgi:hypothetical protein
MVVVAGDAWRQVDGQSWILPAGVANWDRGPFASGLTGIRGRFGIETGRPVQTTTALHRIQDCWSSPARDDDRGGPRTGGMR